MANVPKAQNTANRQNHPLQGTLERQAKKALKASSFALLFAMTVVTSLSHAFAKGANEWGTRLSQRENPCDYPPPP